MAKKKSEKVKRVPRDLIYILVIAVLLIALIVTLCWGGKLGTILAGSDGEGIKTEFSQKEKIILPSEFDGNKTLEIHFIDIGQGDAVAIVFPDGKNMLIDAGSGASRYPSAEVKTNYFNYLTDTLGWQNEKTIDYLLVTHPDADHVNLMSEVIKRYDVDNFYYNYRADLSYTAVYSGFVSDAKAEQGATVNEIGTESASYKIEGEGYSVELYAPGYGTFTEEAVEGNNKNILSVMCVLSYGGRKVMFTGDAEVPTEEWFMETAGGTSLDVDVLKVGHHGSSSCTSEQFLDYIKAEYAVISCDDGEAYHHPHPETMNKLFEYGIVTYRTNRHGNTVLYVADDGDFGFLPEKTVQTENNTKNLDPLTIVATSLQ